MFDDFFDDIKRKIRMFQLPPEIRQKFEGFLSKMGASTRKTVAIAFSQNLGLEMIEIDNLAGKITKYATRPLNYDPINRRMESYTDFVKAIMELFEEIEVSENSNIILSLPNILFGLIEIPQILHGDNVRNVLLSEVEQSYIFKSNEPLVSWCSLLKKREKNKPNQVVYSAIQKDVIENILEASQVMGCRFLTIESSHLSTLRGLSFLGFNADLVKENAIWQFMVIDASMFSIITMKGPTPIKYYEEPLALKSFEEDEIYNAIATSATEVLTSDKIKSKDLLIISQTDLVNAEALKLEMNVSKNIEILNCNKYSQLALYPTSFDIDPEVAEQISLNAIGASAFLFYHYPIYLNYIKETVEERENIDDQIGNIKVNIGNIELNITKNTIRRLSMIFAGVMLLPLFIIFILLGQIFLPMEQGHLKDLLTNIEVVNKQIKDLTEAGKQTKFDINTAIKNNVKHNKEILYKYSAIQEIVPKNLWITDIEQDNKNFVLTGISPSTHIIYDFFKNLQKVTKNESLILSKLETTQESLDSFVLAGGKTPSNLYSFEITSDKEVQRTYNVRNTFNIADFNSNNFNLDSEGKRVTTSVPPEKIDPNATKGEETEKPENNDAVKNLSEGKISLPANLKKIEDF